MRLFLSNKKLSFLILLIGSLYLRPVKAQSHNPEIKYITDTTANFKTLLSQFKGKVVYVDIWATWCGPCRHELQQAKDIRAFADFAKKNNIVILYICDDNNVKAWKSFITANHLAGYHAIAGKSMIDDFHTTFSSVQNRGGVMKKSFYIPRHIIVDQSGTVVDSTANRQGTAAVYQKLNRLLDKG